MNIIQTNNKVDRCIGITLFLMIWLPGFNYYLNQIVVSKLGLPSVSLLLYSLLLFFTFRSTKYVIKEHMYSRIVARLILLLLTLTTFSFILYFDVISIAFVSPDLNPIYSPVIYLLLFCLPALIISNGCRDWSIVLQLLSTFAPVVIATAFVAYFLSGFSTYGDDVMDYMSLSYYLLTSSCVCIFNALSRHNIIHITSSFLAFFIIVAAGCRGALVCYFLFLFMSLYRQIRVDPNKNLSTLFIIVFVLALIITFLGSALSIDFISNWFDLLGINSRAINMIIENSFFEDDARQTIRDALSTGLSDNPFGYSIFGDRYVNYKYYENTIEYAHNIIYEFWIQYGIFFGSFFLFTILYKTYKCLLLKYDLIIIKVLIIIIPYGLIRLFFSSTYIVDIEFFIILGILFNNDSHNYEIS